MKDILQQICLFITAFTITYGYPRPLVTGFQATATARLTANYDRRAVIPTASSSYLKIVVPTDSSLLVDMRQGSKLFVQMSKRRRRAIRERRNLPMTNPSPGVLNSPTSSGSKRSPEEKFVLDDGASEEEASDKFEEEDEEEDDEDVSPTDTTSLVKDDTDDDVMHNDEETASIKSKPSQRSALIESNSESGSGTSEFENTQQDEEDDSDDDSAQPTGGPERKAHIRHKPKYQRVAKVTSKADNFKNEIEKRKLNIAKEQDAEMNRLMKLESDIENMSKDFSMKKRRRSKILG